MQLELGLLARLADLGEARRLARGRGEVAKQEVVRYLESTFEPALSHFQRDFPRMDAIVCFVDGRIDYHDLETLDRVKASGAVSSALGEGLADALNVGGI